MKNILLFCVLYFATPLTALKAQHDSSAVKHPKINLKYRYKYRMRYGVYYKDSTLYGYYFGNDTSYAWNYSKSGSDELMASFMKDDKEAYRHLKKIRTINAIELLPRAISMAGYGSLVILAYTGLALGPTIDIVGLCACGGTFGVGVGLVSLCENAKKKAFLKGVKMYNRYYGYL